MPPAYEAIEIHRQARQAVVEAREAAYAELAEFERDHPFEWAGLRLYGEAALFGLELLVAAAAGAQEALDAVAEIDPLLLPPDGDPAAQRKAAMTAWFTDRRVREDAAFFFDEFPEEVRMTLLEALPDQVAAQVRELQPDHGWAIGVARDGYAFAAG